jgi:hypothetical protein
MGTSNHITFRRNLTSSELGQRCCGARKPNERTWWQIRWLLSQGRTGHDAATVTGYSRSWSRPIAKRCNAEGPQGMYNLRHTTS